MAENSALENEKVEDQKNVKNGEVDVPENETHPLENGDINKTDIGVEEPSTSTSIVQVTHNNTINTDVAQKQETENKATDVDVDADVSVKDDVQVIEGVVKDEIQITHTFVNNKEKQSEIIEEGEEGNNEITRSFEFVHVNEKIAQLNESKKDEIITLQEVTILPIKEEQSQPPKEHKRVSQLVSWDTKKTVFFFFFLFAFAVWIVAYYAFDTGLIPNDKKK